MTKTKEEIWKLNIAGMHPMNDITAATYPAMEEFAKQESKIKSIEFAKWILINDIDYDFGEESWWWNKRTEWLNDEQLYTLFIDQSLK